MKIAVNRLLTDERGAAMVLALVLLLVSGLIVAPLLSHMGTGLVTGEVYETRTAELYAADAGVEDAVWKIQNKDGYLPCSPSSPAKNYSITDVNGKSVDITIASVTLYPGTTNMTGMYRVESTATGNGSGTQIEAYIEGFNIYGDYGDLLGQVITSQGEIELAPGTNVTPSEGDHAPIEYYAEDWPEPWELEEFYYDQVEDEEPYAFDTMDLAGVDMEEGPLYRDGELDIVNSSNTPATLTLTGTFYITGDTRIGSTQKDFTLDLNGQTLFVSSNTSGNKKALEIGDRCTVIGPGTIIAVGDIYFAPKGDVGSDEEPVFVLSVTGESVIQPQGDFYGSVGGSVVVDLQPNTSICYPENDGWYDDLNFLIGVKQLVYSIDSWEVSQE